jgi:hypothetical protein
MAKNNTLLINPISMVVALSQWVYKMLKVLKSDYILFIRRVKARLIYTSWNT